MHEELDFQQAGWHFSGTLGAAASNLDVSVKAGTGDEKIVTDNGIVAGVPLTYAEDVAYANTPL